MSPFLFILFLLPSPFFHIYASSLWFLYCFLYYIFPLLKEGSQTKYSYNEDVLFRLSALDEFGNPREAVWQVEAPQENEVNTKIKDTSSTLTSYLQTNVSIVKLLYSKCIFLIIYHMHVSYILDCFYCNNNCSGDGDIVLYM